MICVFGYVWVCLWRKCVGVCVCLSTKALCVLQSSVHSSLILVSVLVRTPCSWEVFQPSLHLPSSLLLSCCCLHHPSSRTLFWSAAMLGQSSFLWTCCQTGRPWSGSGGGPCLLVARCDCARPVSPGCSSWKHLETVRVKAGACLLILGRRDGQSRYGCSRWSSAAESWVQEVGF